MVLEFPFVAVRPRGCERRNHDHVFRDVYGGGRWFLEDGRSDPVSNSLRHRELNHGLSSFLPERLEAFSAGHFGLKCPVYILYEVSQVNRCLKYYNLC